MRPALGLRTLAAALLGAGVLAAFVAVAGVEETLAAAAGADRGLLAAALLAEAGVVGCWGAGLAAALAALGHPLSLPRAALVFVSTTFASNATPFGRAGGDPFAGWLVARAAGAPYERGLAGIVGVQTVYNVVAVALGVLGAAGAAVLGASAGRGFARAAAVGAGLVAGLSLTLALAWRVRHPAGAALASGLGRAAAWLSAHAPLGARLPDESAVRRRVEGFVAALDPFGTPGLLAALALAGAAGQALVVAALWASLAAVGAPLSPLLLLGAVPLAWVAALGPTPGGLGGTEALLVGVLVAATGAPLPAVTAGVLLFRALTFWLPTLVGGLAAGLIAGPGAGTGPNSDSDSDFESDSDSESDSGFG